LGARSLHFDLFGSLSVATHLQLVISLFFARSFKIFANLQGALFSLLYATRVTFTEQQAYHKTE
jgi:hypothetical protein